MGRLTTSLILSFLSTFAQADVQSDFLLSSSSSIDQIYDAIDRAEIDGGTYAPEMGELWLALGQALKQRQEYEEAIEIVVRGMHIDKVNRGIVSNSQVIYLKELAELKHLSGDAKASAQHTRKAFKLYSKTLADDKKRLLSETLALRALHLEMYDTAENKKYNSPHITAAYFYALEAAFIAEKHLEEQPALQRRAYRDLAQVSYKVARELSRQPPTHYGNARSNMRFSTGSASDMSAQEQDQWLATAYKTGRQALLANLRLGKEEAEKSNFKDAENTAMLADWYLMFGLRTTAAKSYSQAWEYLANDESQAHNPDEYFGEPTPIAMTLIEDEEPIQPARFAIDVTRSGLVKHAEILEVNEQLDEKSRKSLIDRVKSLVFRPKLSNGRPVATTKLEYSFPVSKP